MKRLYTIVLVLVLTMGLAACGEKGQTDNTSGTIVEGEPVLQTEAPVETAASAVTAVPTETNKPQGEEADDGELPIAEFEVLTDKPEADTTTSAPTPEAVAEPTEAPTTVPAENPVKEPEVMPTEAPTAEPTEAPATEPTEDSPIELPFAPIN